MAVNRTTLLSSKSTAGSIKYLVTYDRIDPDTVLTEAQAYIFGALRVREMRKTSPVSIALNATTIALPTGFLDPISLVLYDGLGEIDLIQEQELQAVKQYDTSYTDGTLAANRPMQAAIFNEVINLDCKSDAAYSGALLHYSSADALSASVETNFLTTRYPNLLLAACRMYAYMGYENSEADKWAKITDALIGRANVESDFSRRGADYAVTVR